MKKNDVISLVSGIIALALGLFAIFGMPQDREVHSLGIFLFKLLPFLFGAVAISYFNPKYLYKTKLIFPAFVVAFLIYFAVFVPKIFFYLDMFEKVYYLVLMQVPYIILFLIFSFRMGGGTTENSLRLSLILLLIMLSGIEDLAFLVVNPHTDPQWSTIPEVWTWASHIKVRIGHFPTKYEAYVFIITHFILAGFVAFYPFKYIKGLLGSHEEVPIKK